MSKGYVQLTPIPEKFFQNNNVLDRMAEALDGPDPQEVSRAWFDGEKSAYLQWSGVEDGDWRVSQVTGYPTKFMVFSGPWSAKGAEPLGIEPRLDVILDEISTGAVYGDTGTTLGGKPFSTRSQWKVKPGDRVEGGEEWSGPEVGPDWVMPTLLAVVIVTLLLLWWI